MKISVVILTYNRNDMLKKCLSSLLIGQTQFPDEVVIVNAGVQDPNAVIDSTLKEMGVIKVVKSSNESLTHNRNVGIKSSSYEAIAFTDDDCIVSSNWIESFMEAFKENDNVGSVGGRIVDSNGNGFLHMLEEISMRLSSYYDRIRSPFCYCFRTANVCYSRAAISKVNFFDETFKRTSSDDVLLGVKLWVSGYKNIYVEKSYVNHYGRSTLTGLVKRIFCYGRDIVKVMKLFKGTKAENIFFTEESGFFHLYHMFETPLKIARKIDLGYSFFHVLVCVFIVKFLFTLGIFYEKWRRL